MATLPANVSLANIADGANIVASDHRNNYSSLQAYINALNAILAAGAPGQVLGSSGGTTIGWQNAAVTYRKTTPKVVNTSIASTDLLNGEITIGAGVMGPTGLLRLTAFGDFKNNTGGSLDIPRLTLKLGATTLLDANIAGAAVVATSATRFGWRAVFEIMNNGATNSQWATMDAWWTFANGAVFGANFFATGGGITGTVLNSGALADMVHSHGGNSGAVDTTVAQALTLNVVNGSPSASYETKLFGALVEVV